MVNIKITGEGRESTACRALPGDIAIHLGEPLIFSNSTESGCLFKYVNKEGSIVLTRDTSLVILKKLVCNREV